MLCLDQKGVLRCVTRRLHPLVFSLEIALVLYVQQYPDIINLYESSISNHCIYFKTLEHLLSWPKMPKAAKLPPPEKIELLLEGEIISEDGRLPREARGLSWLVRWGPATTWQLSWALMGAMYYNMVQ